MSDTGTTTTLEIVGRRLREERERCELTLAAAAAELGIHRSVLSRIETGGRGLDSILLRHAAALYEVPMDALFEEAPDELVVKARDGGADAPGVRAMAQWAARKLADLRYVREGLPPDGR